MDDPHDLFKDLNMELYLSITLFAVLVGYSFYNLLRRGERSVNDVLIDLAEVSSTSKSSVFDDAERAGKIHNSPEVLKVIESYSFDPMKDEKRKRFVKSLPFIMAGLFCFILLVLGKKAPFSYVMFSVLGLSGGYIIGRNKLSKAKIAYRKNLEFFLPVVMERVVMAVQAGLDVVPALKAILELDLSAKDNKRSEKQMEQDPVSKLLQAVVKLTEAGLGFEQSLKEVASKVDCVAVKHAFIHLSVAQKEGGEIIAPLKELSDSTQMYYQDSVEEEIAKMPVKATMPLLCTFAGLIILFITTPLIQVITVAAKALPK